MIIVRSHIFVSLSLEIIMKIILNVLDNHRIRTYTIRLSTLIINECVMIKEITIIQHKKINHLNHLSQFLRVI